MIQFYKQFFENQQSAEQKHHFMVHEHEVLKLKQRLPS